MELVIRIQLDNAAFSFDNDEGPEDGANGAEVARILDPYVREWFDGGILEAGESYKLRDCNGNTCGTLEVR